MVDTETYTVGSPDGDTDAVELPAGLVDVLAEQGERNAAVVGDVTLMAFAQRAHALVHHSEDVREMADGAEELFEQRFGVSFGEATGHSH